MSPLPLHSSCHCLVGKVPTAEASYRYEADISFIAVIGLIVTEGERGKLDLRTRVRDQIEI